jgi:hypothetical protein
VKQAEMREISDAGKSTFRETMKSGSGYVDLMRVSKGYLDVLSKRMNQQNDHFKPASVDPDIDANINDIGVRNGRNHLLSKAKRMIWRKNADLNATKADKEKTCSLTVLYNFITELILLQCLGMDVVSDESRIPPGTYLGVNVSMNTTLKNTMNALAQQWHYDRVLPQQEENNCALTALVGMNDGSLLDVIPFSQHNFEEKMKNNPSTFYNKIPLHAGSIIIFHANLVHRGSMSLEGNKRIHLYISRKYTLLKPLFKGATPYDVHNSMFVGEKMDGKKMDSSVSEVGLIHEFTENQKLRWDDLNYRLPPFIWEGASV